KSCANARRTTGKFTWFRPCATSKTMQRRRAARTASLTRPASSKIPEPRPCKKWLTMSPGRSSASTSAYSTGGGFTRPQPPPPGPPRRPSPPPNGHEPVLGDPLHRDSHLHADDDVAVLAGHPGGQIPVRVVEVAVLADGEMTQPDRGDVNEPEHARLRPCHHV